MAYSAYYLTHTFMLCYNRHMDAAVVIGGENEQVNAIRALNSELPLNDFGLPTGIYRVDFLPWDDYDPNPAPVVALPSPSEVGSSESYEASSLEDDVARSDSIRAEYRIAGFLAQSLQRAFVPLQYDEGFPAFESGYSFWHQFPNESLVLYQAFETYLRMNAGKPAIIGDFQADETVEGDAASGSRGIAELVDKLHPELEGVELLAALDHYRDAFHIYYWGLRARAYDLFRVAQHRKQQELRAIETQDEHYIDARNIRAKIMEYMGSNDEFWDLMTPKVALDALKLATSLERISAGLPTSGPAAANAVDRTGQSLEVAFRTIAQDNNVVPEGVTMDKEGHILDEALTDPEKVRVLQEIIIRQG